jgi:hypothetical protein
MSTEHNFVTLSDRSKILGFDLALALWRNCANYSSSHLPSAVSFLEYLTLPRSKGVKAQTRKQNEVVLILSFD